MRWCQPCLPMGLECFQRHDSSSKVIYLRISKALGNLMPSWGIPFWELEDFPCGSAGKESPCNVGDLSSISGLGRTPGEGKGYLPTPVFWPREFHGLYSPWDRKEADTTEWLSLSGNLMQFIYFSGCNNPFEGQMSNFIPLLVYNSMSLWTTTSFFPSGHHYHPKVKHWPQVTKHIGYDVQVNPGKKWLWTLTLCAIEGTCVDDMGSIV